VTQPPPAGPPPAWQSAVNLLRYLDSGHELRPMPTAIRLGTEPIYADLGLTSARVYAMDVVADQRTVSAAGGLVFIAGAFAANAARNAHARRQAQRRSVPQWREHAPARVVLTGRQTMCQVGGAWLSFPFTSVIEFQPDLRNAACITTFDGAEPMLLMGPSAAYYAVMLAFLLYGREHFTGLPELAPLVASARMPAELPPPARPEGTPPSQVISGEIV
jgi:hypothetical protein